MPCARSNMRATLAKAHACELVAMAAIGYGTWWGTVGFATRSAPNGVHLHYRAHPSSRHGAGTAPDLGGLHFDSSPETSVPCQLCCSTPRAPTHRYLPAVGAPSLRTRKASLKCWFSNLSVQLASRFLALPFSGSAIRGLACSACSAPLAGWLCDWESPLVASLAELVGNVTVLSRRRAEGGPGGPGRGGADRSKAETPRRGPGSQRDSVPPLPRHAFRHAVLGASGQSFSFDSLPPPTVCPSPFSLLSAF